MSQMSVWAFWTIFHNLYVFVALFIVVVLILTMLADHFLAPAVPSARIRPPAVPQRPVVLVLALLAIALAWAIAVDADLTFQDAVLLFPTATPGHPQWSPPPMWMGEGRFYPLAFAPIELWSLISKTLVFYNVCIALEFILILWVAARLIGATWGMTLAIALCLVSSAPVTDMLTSPLSQERNVVLLFVVTLATAAIYRDTRSRFALAAAVVCGCLMLFFKEVAFLLAVAITAVAAIPFALRRADQGSRGGAVVGFGLACAAGLWLATYAFVFLPTMSGSYTASRNLSITFLDCVLNYLHATWFYVLLGSIAVRLFLLRKAPLNFPLDGLAIGSLLYAAAIAYFRLPAYYYVAPSACTAYIYAAFVARHFSSKFWVITAILCIVTQLPQSAPLVESRKEGMMARGQAAAYIESHSQGTIRLHSQNSAAYGAGLFAGLIRARTGRDVVLSVDGTGIKFLRDIDGQKKLCVGGWQDPGRPEHRQPELFCWSNLPVQSGDFIVSFGKPAPHPAWPLVLKSSDVGFWKNKYRLYVYRAK